MTAINGAVIYRDLGNPIPVLLAWLQERTQLYNVVDDKGLEHLYVDNDIPRDSEITELIVGSTGGFALFTEQGKRIEGYTDLHKAVRAQASAQLTVVPEVELESHMEVEEDAALDDAPLEDED